jgi:hypothetical protein
VLLRLKALLDDFSGPAVDAAATLVENAGRFLLRLPGKPRDDVSAAAESEVRMEILLLVMMRLPSLHAAIYQSINQPHAWLLLLLLQSP